VSRARVSPQARVDLLEIWHRIAKDSLQNAGKVWSEIEDAIRLLSDWPGLGHTRQDIKNPSLKCWAVHAFVIIYRPRGRGIEVVRIVDGRRDFRKIFRR
jgi:toxin ParE1/3/4